MKKLVLIALLLTSVVALAQIGRIEIPAGTPEDRAAQAINAEGDSAKKTAMWQDFLKNFSSNPQAVAFGNWQLSEQYKASGDLAKALEHGTKAAEAQPNNMDILVSVADIARQMKNAEVVVDCAAKGGVAFNGISKQAKPESVSEEKFAEQVKSDLDSARQGYEFLEASALDSIANEPDAKKRMGYIERFMTAFPSSRFEEQIGQLSVYTVSQLNDPARLATFGDNLLKANPNSVGTLVLLAGAFVENDNSTYVARGEGYARKAIELLKTQKETDPKKQTLYSGMAHSALGLALIKQGKSAPAISELKQATTELKDEPTSYSTALYRLAFAYVNSKNYPEAKAVLKQGVTVQGPYQAACKDMLSKMEAAATRAK